MLSAYLVDSLDDTVLDDELTTLREALQAANTNTALWDGDIPAGSDTETDVITFDPSLSGGTITLGGTQLEITDTAAGVDIEGLGAESLTINADGGSRIFHIGEGVVAHLSALGITGGVATNGGGIYNNRGELTVIGSTIFGNSASLYGGALYSKEGTVTVTDSTFSGNSAGYMGGGVNSHTTTLTITDSTISGNSAEYDGGGIRSTGSIIEITDSTISGNPASRDGGGVFAYSGELTLTNVIVSGNSGSLGAGIHSEEGALTVTGCTISDNIGVGIYSGRNGTMSIAETDVSGNASTRGAICNYGPWSSATIVNSTISDNVGALVGGGGVQNDWDCTLTITDSTVSGNEAFAGAAGVGNAGTLTLLNVTITDNVVLGDGSTSEGGGIYNCGTMAVTGSMVAGNSAEYGGGIINHAEIAITDSTISGNSAATSGGGIYNGGTATVSRSTMAGNSAEYGGGIWSDDTLTATNSIILGNSARWYGGGIRVHDGILAVRNSTVTTNSASLHGGGVCNEDGETTLQNSIVALNNAPGGPDTYGSLEPESSHNLIGVDPGFLRDPSPGDDDTWGTEDDDYGDLHVHSNSPAVNAGDNALAVDAESDPLETDLDGKPRIVYEVVDIGAYEYCLAGDADYDGLVGPADTAVMAANWGCEGTPWVPGDVNGDGNVDEVDAQIVGANWGEEFVPPSGEASSGPCDPAAPVNDPLVGPVDASPDHIARQRIMPVARDESDSEGNSPVFASERLGRSAAAHDVALAEQHGPQVEERSLQRRRLAFSHALARRQMESQEDSADDKTALAVDLLLKCEM